MDANQEEFGSCERNKGMSPHPPSGLGSRSVSGSEPRKANSEQGVAPGNFSSRSSHEFPPTDPKVRGLLVHSSVSGAAVPGLREFVRSPEPGIEMRLGGGVFSFGGELAICSHKSQMIGSFWLISLKSTHMHLHCFSWDK